MYGSKIDRTAQLTRADTPVDMIRYADKGHVPPNSKKVRSVVGRSNRHDADPMTAGRASYKAPETSAGATTSVTFNRSAHYATNTNVGSSMVSTALSLNSSALRNPRSNTNMSVGGGGGAEGGGGADHNDATLMNGPLGPNGTLRHLSTTPTVFLHSTRGANSSYNISAMAIPKLKEEDRVVDSLDNMLRDSAMAARSPNSLTQLGGTGCSVGNVVDVANTAIGGGVVGAVSSVSGTPLVQQLGRDTGMFPPRASSSMGRNGEPYLNTSGNGNLPPDPRMILKSIREQRLASRGGSRPRDRAGTADSSQLHSHPAGIPSVMDSRARFFTARAGSALAGAGCHAETNNSTNGLTDYTTTNAAVFGAPATHTMATTRMIGSGHNPHMNRSQSAQPCMASSSMGGGQAGSVSRRPADPHFFSQSVDRPTTVQAGRASSSAMHHHSNNTSGIGGASVNNRVFDALKTDALRPKLRFELTDYHSTFNTFQAPANSGMGQSSLHQYSAGDRGLGANLVGQEDRMKKAATSAARADARRGNEQYVRDAVDAEGSRMRMLRDNRSVARSAYGSVHDGSYRHSYE